MLKQSLLFILVVNVSTVYAAKLSCKNWMTNPLRSEIYIEANNVIVNGIVPNSYGLPVYKIELKSKMTWDDLLNRKSGAHQGSINWMYHLLGPKAGKLWGYNGNSAPTSTTLNRVIKIFNMYLRKKYGSRAEDHIIPIVFEDVVGQIDDPFFIRKFAIENKVLMAISTTDLIHDLSYHIGQIFYPSYAQMRAQKVRQVVLEYIDHYLVPTFKSLGATDEGIEFTMESIYKKLASDYDTGNGNAILALEHTYITNEMSFDEAAVRYSSQFSNYLVNGYSFESYLREFLPSYSFGVGGMIEVDPDQLIKKYFTENPDRQKDRKFYEDANLTLKGLSARRLFIKKISEEIVDEVAAGRIKI